MSTKQHIEMAAWIIVGYAALFVFGLFFASVIIAGD